MTKLEIRKKIDANNKMIEEAMTPNMFTLNNIVSTLLEDNRKLQYMCQHEVDENGYCVWCDLEVTND